MLAGVGVAAIAVGVLEGGWQVAERIRVRRVSRRGDR
jgi:hypothetical protein